MWGSGDGHAKRDRGKPLRRVVRSPDMNRARRLGFVAAVLGGGLAAGYCTIVRPWALRWGQQERK
jgi:hypothetical protein